VSPHPPPSPSWQKSHLLAPYRCVKFEREKKLSFFFVEEMSFLRPTAKLKKHFLTQPSTVPSMAFIETWPYQT
jgi:hypothetical protein